jgi:Protein of unknown function (DUF3768)
MGNAAKIAALNDRFRKQPERYGKAYVTDGVSAHEPEFVARAMAATAAFDAFTTDNDPYGEHDFGSFQLDGEKLFWKIDCVDKADPDRGAEDPSDPTTTARVLTVMLADEY